MGGFLNDDYPVEKDETGGNMKDSGMSCWKNYAIKASFIKDFA